MQRNETWIKELDVKLNNDFSEAEKIWSFKSNVESIVYNLLENAIRFSSKKRQPEIYIKTSNNNDDICLIVADNGLGIDLRKYRDKLFNLYQRFHPNISGKGIGLYLIKMQTEKLEGKIEVESKVDVGTTFKVFMKNWNKEN